MTVTRKLQAILACDVVGFSNLFGTDTSEIAGDRPTGRNVACRTFPERQKKPTRPGPRFLAPSSELVPPEMAKMDIAHWLRTQGLQQYEAIFRQNDIDADVLPTLGADDLRELGITSLGHRKKLLAAIALLADQSGVSIAAENLRDDSAVSSSASSSAERRQLTVMFCDLVGSTALAAQPRSRGPARGDRRLSSPGRQGGGSIRRVCRQIHGRWRAHLFRLPAGARGRCRTGGAGWAEAGRRRWTRSCLERKPHLQVRVGIATGLVVVGDLIGSGEAQERGIVGETPNLAARLQGIAEPNTVVIAEGTRKLLGNLFELADLGPKDLKGISGPVPAWSPLRAGSAEGRFEAMHATGVTELVGREEELELLLRRWSRAKTGEGQVVLLSGEPGIGKSRLTAALLESIAGHPHTRLRHFCSPQHTDSALYPIISQLERAAGLKHGDSPQQKLDKLDRMLAQTATSQEDAALFAELLSLPNDGRYPALDLAPQQRRQRTLDALGSQVEALARQNPVLMIFEDAHWADPTSLELFGQVINRIAHLRVLLIVTFRPEFEPPWIGRPHVTALTINRLAKRDVDIMIERVLGNKNLPANIRHDITERTDGIPLFVEEMTKAVLEAGSEGAARQLAALPSSALAVPASLHASLMARLDRLGPAREVAQIGSAIGREFSHALLAAVVRKPEMDLNAALDRLVQSGLLFRQGVPPHATYLFKHALVQDAAYGTLLREPRRALHARIAEVLESQFAEIVESQPELLARHCTEARLIAESRGPMGQGGAAIVDALGADRGRGAIHARARRDGGLAGHGGPAPGPDRGAGRARERSGRHQGPCGARDKVGVSSSARPDERS